MLTVPIEVVLGRTTVPIKVGLAELDFRSSAVCWTVETGLEVSAVLSTEESPTSALVKTTVPVLPATELTAPAPYPCALTQAVVAIALDRRFRSRKYRLDALRQ